MAFFFKNHLLEATINQGKIGCPIVYNMANY